MHKMFYKNSFCNYKNTLKMGSDMLRTLKAPDFPGVASTPKNRLFQSGFHFHILF